MIFSKTSELRDKEKVSFRSFRKEAEKKREVSLKWSEKMKEKFAKGMDEKKVIGQTKERKRLEMLEEIKKFGGPFTNADQVQEFLNDASINDVDAKRRLKLELKFARDSSTSLPKSDPIFRIQVTQPNKVTFKYLSYTLLDIHKLLFRGIQSLGLSFCADKLLRR